MSEEIENKIDEIETSENTTVIETEAVDSSNSSEVDVSNESSESNDEIKDVDDSISEDEPEDPDSWDDSVTEFSDSSGKKDKSEYIVARKQRKLERQLREKDALIERMASGNIQNQNNLPQFNQNIPAPVKSDFDSDESFIDARTNYSIAMHAQKLQHHQAKVFQAQAQKKHHDELSSLMKSGSKIYPDFEEKVSALLDPNGDFPSNHEMYRSMIESEHSAKLFYFLSHDQDKVEKAREIANMSPIQAVKTIAKIEAAFDKSRLKKKRSKSARISEPMKKSAGGSSVRRVEDMTAAELDSMPQSEFNRLEKQQKRLDADQGKFVRHF